VEMRRLVLIPKHLDNNTEKNTDSGHSTSLSKLIVIYVGDNTISRTIFNTKYFIILDRFYVYRLMVLFDE
jgi:hypothetical protein